MLPKIPLHVSVCPARILRCFFIVQNHSCADNQRHDSCPYISRSCQGYPFQCHRYDHQFKHCKVNQISQYESQGTIPFYFQYPDQNNACCIKKSINSRAKPAQARHNSLILPPLSLTGWIRGFCKSHGNLLRSHRKLCQTHTCCIINCLSQCRTWSINYKLTNGFGTKMDRSFRNCTRNPRGYFRYPVWLGSYTA